MKKLLSVFIFIFACLFGLTLVSCSGGKDIKVKSFTTTNSSYSEGDTLSFVITLTNSTKYDVVSCKINDNSYTTTELGLTKEKYSITTDLKYSSASSYMLSEITYMDGETSKTLKVNKKASPSETADTINDIKVTKISFKSLTNDDEIFANDDVQAVVTLQKNNPVTVLNFYFTFTDVNGGQETIKKGIMDDGNSNVYTVDLTLPAMVGSVIATVSNIDYTKNTKREKLTQNEVNSTLVVNIHDVEVVDAKVTPKTALSKDVNDLYYFDSSSSIEVEIKLTNESNLDVTKIVVSGSEVNINKGDITKYTNLKMVVIKKTINLDSESSPIKLTLDSVSYTKGGKERKINQVLIEDDYYYYSKIITKASDFNSMNVDTKTKKITGRYIIANDIVLTGQESYLFNGYTLDGTIEFNGHLISSSTIYGQPMFEKLTERACIQNLQVNYSMSNSPSVCEANYGTLNNIKLTGPVSSKVVTSLDKKNLKYTSVLCDSNMLNGVIKNIEFASQLEGDHSFFTLINKNYGELKDVVVNPSTITFSSNVLNALPLENNGKVASVLILVENWFTGINASDVSNQNTLIIEYTSAGEYKNIILNKAFSDNVNTLNKILNGPSTTSPTVIGKIFDVAGKLEKSFEQLVAEGLASTSPELANFLGFGNSRTTWNSYLENGLEDGESSSIKEYEKKSLSQNLTSGFGFLAYDNGNNCFWRNVNGTVSLNFTIKR